VIDPRLDIIQRRLAPVKRILVFASAKGGVGKSFCTAATAVELASRGLRTAVLDLDFQGASAHLFLGASLGFPEEEGGIKPLPVRENLELMSFAAFSGERAVPLRGEGVREAMLELLAITIWNPLDYLLVDMPPGIGDELLDLLRYVGRAEFVVIATPSPVVIQVVDRLLGLLRSLDAPVLGIVENMAREAPQARAGRTQEADAAEQTGQAGTPRPARDPGPVRALSERHSVPLIATVPFVPEAESAPLSADGALGRAFTALADALRR
jgi:ATP-binding protein involved in chromosome partitioning